MKVAAIVCFAFAGVLVPIGIANILGPNAPEQMENWVGYAVGSFLLPLLFLIAGAALWSKQKK